jgi:predicted nucleic acid-binding protein
VTFAGLLAGDAVFVDANTFLYHLAPDPVLGPPCSQLLQRIENQELTGFTSLHLLGEVAHKMMTLEASALFGWPLTGMANRLRRHPAEVQRLTAFRQAIERLVQIRETSFR